jgi:flagellin
MALTIATNSAALQAAASASSVNRDMETSMARLSTGKRINTASDDAAGVAIASRLSAEIRGTDQAIRNALDGQALIDSAEGGHKEIENILQRMREVSVQAANDTNDADDRNNLQMEVDALLVEIDRIASTTTFAGQTLMAGGTTFSLQVGSSTGAKNQIDVAISAVDATGLSLKTTGLTAADITLDADPDYGQNVTGSDAQAGFKITSAADTSGQAKMVFSLDTDGDDAATNDQVFVFTSTTSLNGAGGNAPTNVAVVGEEITAQINSNAGLIKLGVGATYNSAEDNVVLTFADYAPSFENAEHALASVAKIDAAIKTVNTQRSELGAVSNRLSHTVSNMTNISTNLSAARGGIEDADFALETTELAKNQILQQASTAMLAQANASKQNVLSLLQ